MWFLVCLLPPEDKKTLLLSVKWNRIKHFWLLWTQVEIKVVCAWVFCRFTEPDSFFSFSLSLPISLSLSLTLSLFDHAALSRHHRSSHSPNNVSYAVNTQIAETKHWLTYTQTTTDAHLGIAHTGRKNPSYQKLQQHFFHTCLFHCSTLSIEISQTNTQMGAELFGYDIPQNLAMLR